MKNTKENARTEYTRNFTALRGMNPRGSVDDSFFYLENMYVDYEGGGEYVESVPGFRKIFSPKEEIHSIGIYGISEGEKSLLIHAGENLYRLPVSERDSNKKLSPIATLSDTKSRIFSFGKLAFIADGKSLWLVNSDGQVKRISDDTNISSCTKAAIYDRKLFLAGCPKLPCHLFYSTPLDEENISFSPDAFIKESVSGVPIRSLLSFGGLLWIFMETDGGEGSIICRKATPRKHQKYPAIKQFCKIKVLSDAVVFGGEIHFLSEGGLMAIKNPLPETESKLVHCSMPIDAFICRENFENVSLGIWMGYLALSFGERIYLADSRCTEQYRWYFINGVGGYKNDRRVYRYLSTEAEGCIIHPCPDGVAEGEIISHTLPDGRIICYTHEGENRYGVYPTEELFGGEFSPAREFVSDGSFLWFATKDQLYLFNNDKRGTSAEEKAKSDLNNAENEPFYKSRIHPDYYSFAGHAPRYAVVTHYDDCGLAANEKSSAPDSLFLELSTFERSSFTLCVMADGVQKSSIKVCPASLNFSDLNFQSIGMHAGEGYRVNLSERAALWYKKRLVLVGGDFASPFGIKSVCYRYRLKGEGKKT